MKFLIKDFLKLKPATQRLLTRNTPVWKDDFMREACQFAHKRQPGSYIAIALYTNATLIGWAMLDFYLSGQSPAVRTYIYVKPKYRRNGYGTQIFEKTKEKAKRMGRTIRVCPHDRRSAKFFQSVNITKSEIAPGYTLQ